MPGKKGIVSKAQQGYLFAHDPKVAEKMMKEAQAAGVDTKHLPKYSKKKKGK